MNIFVDESGNFSTAKEPYSWCVIAAYASPELDRRALADLVHDIRKECAQGKEAKLRDLDDHRYLRFLKDLGQLHGVGFAVAIDVSLHTADAVERHRDQQAWNVEEHKDRMRYETARQGLVDTAQLIRSLPIQLYSQLVCQVQLFHSVIVGSTLFYSQRIPQTLGNFRWRVDRKDTIPTAYEKAFKTVLPALLQTISFRDPLPMLEGANYSFFDRFKYTAETMPRYLEEEYGQPRLETAANIGLIVGENFQLVDSDKTPGVQVADLLASGIRRLLRGGFDEPSRIAAHMGPILLQRAQRAPPVQIISVDYSGPLQGPAGRLLRLMEKTAKRMLVAEKARR